MQYEVFDAFKVPRRTTGAGNRVLKLDTNTLNEFWAEIDEDEPYLSQAQGCYLFGIRAAKGIRPWYVGQTTNSFQGECFQPHKCMIYQQVYGEFARGTPILLLIARLTQSGNAFYRGNGLPNEFDFLEKMLMFLALGQNSDLANKRDTKMLRELTVPGVFNKSSGRVPTAAQALQIALGLKKTPAPRR